MSATPSGTPAPVATPAPAAAPPRVRPPNKVEKAKSEKDGLDVLADIERYARGGLACVDKTDMEIRFRWVGVYTQRPEEDGFFMVRVRIAGGQLNTTQLRRCADLAEQHARGVADVTTRQNFQYHFVRLESLPVIFEGLREVGLTTLEACGDVPRNICGCPVAGRDAGEVLDATPLVNELHRRLVGFKAYSNLPRKFKSAAAGCSIRCHQPEINDLGFTGVRHPDGRIGYEVRVGGGLAVRPHFAKPLHAFIPPEVAPDVGVAVTEIFRDHGYREKRNRARLKFLVADWGAEKFLDVLNKKLAKPLEPFTPPTPPEDRAWDHVGVHAQKQAGLHYVGIPIGSGRMTVEKMRLVADLADRLGSGRVALTQKQNVLIFDVPTAKVPELTAALAAGGLPADPATFRRSIIACTGTEFCKLAVVETKVRANSAMDHLDKVFGGSVGTGPGGSGRDVFVSFTGCPNSCAQYQIAEIGLVGQGRKIDGKLTDHYAFHVGGGCGKGESFGREVGVMVPAAQVEFALENLLSAYKANRREGESFRQFSQRTDDAAVIAMIKTGRELTHVHEYKPDPVDD